MRENLATGYDLPKAAARRRERCEIDGGFQDRLHLEKRPDEGTPAFARRVKSRELMRGLCLLKMGLATHDGVADWYIVVGDGCLVNRFM